jgi:DNA-binding CsgD family transcriptional regulator
LLPWRGKKDYHQNIASPTHKSEEQADVRGSNLTVREIEVLQLLAEELTSKEIADRLGISKKTVNFHRHSMKKRLKVRGTVGIIRYAIREGIIEA